MRKRHLSGFKMNAIFSKGIFKSFRLRKRYATTVAIWLGFAILVGAVCGLIGTAFDLTLEFVSELFGEHGWLIWLLPAAGVIIVFLYKTGGVKKDNGSDMIVHSVREGIAVPYLVAPLVFLGTALTQLCGGSSGREGAALQMGGAVGTFIGRTLRLREKNTNILAMCGMAALFSAVFGTPIAASVFSIEMISVGTIYYMAFFPCLLSSVIAYLLAVRCGVVPTAQKLARIVVPELSVSVLLKALLLGLLFSLICILFVVCTHSAAGWAAKLMPNAYIRVAVGGALLIALTYLVQATVGGRDYNGAGMNMVIEAVSGNARPEAFLLKILFTAITLGCGFKGGKIVPGFFIGATTGCVLAGWIGLPPSFGAALGLVALFSGMTNCPLAALVIGIELFGGEGLIYFAMMAAILYMLAGYYSFYAGREAVFSKLQEDYIHQSKRGLGERIK